MSAEEKRVKFTDGLPDSPDPESQVGAEDNALPSDSDPEAQDDSGSPSNEEDAGDNATPLFLTAMIGNKLNRIVKGLRTEEEEILETNQQRVDLYRQVCSMLDISVLVAFYAGLRHLAREDKLKEADLIMNLPVTMSDVVRCIRLNMNTVMSELGTERYGVFENFLDAREKKLEESAVRMGTTYNAVEAENQQGVFHFGDDKSQQELVYAIFLDGIRKRVVVVFRGTTTFSDLKQDLRAYQEVVESPFKHIQGMSPSVRIHLGFHEYLHADERKQQEEKYEESVKEVEESAALTEREKIDRRAFLLREKSNVILEMEKLESQIGQKIDTKCDLILNQAIVLLEKNPGFQLYITGHSMGGALATLFGSMAATSDDPNIPKPVTCISFSSPKVGNIHFKQVYEKLEQDKLIRKVRVLHGLDPIPKTPTPGFIRVFFYVFCPWSIYDAYSHVGIQLKVQETGFQISYEKYRGPFWLAVQELHKILKGVGYWLYLVFLCRIITLFKYHSCSEIFARLRDNHEEIEKETIDGLYDRILNKGESGILAVKVHALASRPKIETKKSSKKTQRRGNVGTPKIDISALDVGELDDNSLEEPLLQEQE